jgi:hypothetical protein
LRQDEKRRQKEKEKKKVEITYFKSGLCRLTRVYPDRDAMFTEAIFVVIIVSYAGRQNHYPRSARTQSQKY